MKTEKTAKHDGLWITEEFGHGYKLMAGIGQVLRYCDTYEDAVKARAMIRKAEGREG